MASLAVSGDEPPALYRQTLKSRPRRPPSPHLHASAAGGSWGDLQDPLCLLLYHPLASRSEEHTSELQSLMRISYAVFCLKQKNYVKTKQQAKSRTANIQYTIPTQ